MNVYTRPEFRRRGLATEVQKLMIADAKTLGLSNLELGAADQGAPVCRKLGKPGSARHGAEAATRHRPSPERSSTVRGPSRPPGKIPALKVTAPPLPQ